MPAMQRCSNFMCSQLSIQHPIQLMQRTDML